MSLCTFLVQKLESQNVGNHGGISLIRKAIDSTNQMSLEKQLARYLLSLEVGEQILNTRDLAEKLDSSLGSISSTLNFLEESGAVKINRRGHLGSFLDEKSIGTLWNIIEEGPMVIATTLPSFPKCEGLASAVYTLLNDAGVETYLIFIRGSNNRLEALRDGRCHAIIMSELAADALCGKDEEVILRLPPKTFVTDHRVFYKREKQDTSRPFRVGIDHESFDIKYLTELEFGETEVEFQEMPFLQIDLYLGSSHVDAAISNLDHMGRLISSNDLTSRPLSPKVQALIGDRDTSATLIARSNSVSEKIVLQTILDPKKVVKIQEDVEQRRIIPRY
jgi:hypothetical protein